jgi:hypothetical protein
MRRIAALAVLVTVFVLVGTEVIGGVAANPFGFAKQIDAPLDANPPVISINSPQNNTDYPGTFNISFSVIMPQYYSKSAIIDVFYTIDNSTVTIPRQFWTLVQGPDICQYSTSIITPTLPAGNHSLKIRAQGASYDFNNYFIIDGYSQVYFYSQTYSTVSDNRTQNNPIPTQNVGLDNNQSLPTIPVLAIISLIVIVAIASVSLVYFKRTRKRHSNAL